MASPEADDAGATLVARRTPPRASLPSASVVIRDKSPTVVPLDRFQDAMPRPLRGIPVQATLAATGLAAIGALVVTLVLLRSDKAIAALEEDAPAPTAATTGAPRGAPSATSAAPKAPAPLSAAELEAARSSGVDALAALARRFPDDPGVLQALGVAQVREKKDLGAALRSLRHLLEVSSATRSDREVQEALIDLANGPPEVAAEAFELIRTKLGPAGPDLIFDLAQNATGKYAKEHAPGALDDPALMRAASRALVVADQLRRAAPCSRRPLVSKAAADGDGRSLPFLRQMVATKPCGGLTAFFRGPDCPANTCMTPADRTAVASAVAAIEKREPGSPPKTPASASATPAPSTQKGGAGMLR